MSDFSPPRCRCTLGRHFWRSKSTPRSRSSPGRRGSGQCRDTRSLRRDIVSTNRQRKWFLNLFRFDHHHHHYQKSNLKASMGYWYHGCTLLLCACSVGQRDRVRWHERREVSGGHFHRAQGFDSAGSRKVPVPMYPMFFEWCYVAKADSNSILHSTREYSPLLTDDVATVRTIKRRSF